MKINESAQKGIVGILIVGAVFFAILYNPANKATKIVPQSKSAVNVSVNVEDKIFTLDELAKYNGKNGAAAYVAVDGIVYDVTNAEGWKNGVHKKGITAGKDITNEFSKSPHGKSVVKNLNIVGKLQ